MIPILMISCALVSAGAPGQTPTPLPNPALVRVFVRTDDGGQGSELAARRESVKDLASALASKKKTIALVDDEDTADLVLEVVSRGVTVPKVVIGLRPRPGDPSRIAGMSGPVRAVSLRVQLAFGDEAIAWTNRNKPAESSRGWKSAADDIGGQIEKWVAEHRAEILKRRGTDATR